MKTKEENKIKDTSTKGKKLKKTRRNTQKNTKNEEVVFVYNPVSDIARQIIEIVDCPYIIINEESEYDDIIRTYKSLRSKGKKEGFIPIIVAVDQYLLDLLNLNLHENGFTREVLLSAEVESNEGKHYFQEDWKERSLDIREETWTTYPREIRTTKDFMTNNYLTLDQGDDIIIFNIPTTKPWEILAYLPYGGTNSCPLPDQLMAICKYWNEKYGAVPVGFSKRYLEFHVPASYKLAKAEELATEISCLDEFLIDQDSSGPREVISQYLRGARIWHFKWM